MKVAVVGIGFLGSRVAQTLVASEHHVTVFDRSDRALSTAPAGTVRAESLAHAVTQQDVLLLLPRTSEQLEGLVREILALLSAAGSGTKTKIISCATVSFSVARAMEDLCRKAGVVFVDAPVNGRPPDMTVFIGGDDAAVEQLGPLLRCIAKHLHHMGPSGSGTATKLVHQAVLFGTHLILQEALSLGCSTGLDRRALMAALQESSAGSAALDRLAAGFTSEDLRGASIDLIGKDMDLVTLMTSEIGLDDSELLKRLHEVYVSARRHGGNTEHFSKVLDYTAGPSAGDSTDAGALVVDLIDLVNTQNLDQLENVLDETFEWHGIDGKTISGIDAYRQRLASTDYTISIERLIVEGDTAAARLHIERGDGTGRVTNDIFRVEGGRIHEEWSGHD